MRWSDLGLFLGCYALLGGGLVRHRQGRGQHLGDHELDESVADWFVDQRTPDLDIATKWGSGLADTFVKIGVTALLAIAMRVAWKRWREPLMMVVPLVLEAAAFITVTYMIARPRPDDPLETSPVNSSFPSGHVAAATAYGALVIIVFWHTRKFWIRALVVIVSVAHTGRGGAVADVSGNALPERRRRRCRTRHGGGRSELVDDPPGGRPHRAGRRGSKRGSDVGLRRPA